MRMPPAREQAVIETIMADPSQCYLFAKDEYTRPNGSLLCHRDNLQELFHRRLYRKLVDPGLSRGYLRRECESWGCQNPFHYRPAAQPPNGTSSHCPHGHPYLPGNLTVTGHCLTCFTARLASRRTGSGPDAAEINAMKRFCPHNHEYTEENTYRYATPTGVQRKCKTCTRQRNRERQRARRRGSNV